MEKMKEEEPKQPSIWEKLTPNKALDLAERILCGIKNGELPKEIYEPIADKLITFACEGKNRFSDPQVVQITPTKNLQKQPHKTEREAVSNIKTPHSLGLSQLPTAEQALYKRRRIVSRSIHAANKDGRTRVKNKNRKY